MPSHWRPRLVDLNIESLTDRDILDSDVVMLTGMHVQRDSLHEVLRRCRKLGVPTVVGGPYATGEPHKLEADADYLFLGEAEDSLAGFCEAFEAGRAPKVTPRGEAPDLKKSPPPRYDLLKPGFYYHMSLQFSRGCPFLCEFCDIPGLLGRNPRTKNPEQIVNELDAIKATGFGGMVFFVEDNFIGKKKSVRDLLPYVEKWQNDNRWPFEFYTEASLNLAEDSPLMEGMTAAGFRMVFVGLESVSPEALKETKKNQNVTGDMLERVHTILGHGLEVLGGFIVGFDSDGPDIFDRQVEFIQKAGVPTAMLGVLQALPNTPLETRMRAEGRLQDMPRPQDQFGRANFQTVLPAPVLLAGFRRALEALYEPKAYFARVREMLRLRRRLPQTRKTESHRPGLGPAGDPGPGSSLALPPRLLAVPAGHLAMGQDPDRRRDKACGARAPLPALHPPGRASAARGRAQGHEPRRPLAATGIACRRSRGGGRQCQCLVASGPSRSGPARARSSLSLFGGGGLG